MALTKETLLQAMERLFSADSPMSIRPDTLILAPHVKDELLYLAHSRVIRAWPRANRYRGPDGFEWLEARWQTANVAEGNGNRAKRRMGLVPVAVWGGEYEWRRP